MLLDRLRCDARGDQNFPPKHPRRETVAPNRGNLDRFRCLIATGGKSTGFRARELVESHTRFCGSEEGGG